jgi:hypothetical protein
MTDLLWQEEIAKKVRILQVIVGALLGGVLVFLGIVVALVQLNIAERLDDMAFVLNLVLLVFATSMAIARAIVLPIMVSQARRKIREGTWQISLGTNSPGDVLQFVERTGDAGRLFVVYQMRTIVAAAMPEGIAFFACIVYLLGHSLLALAIAAVMTTWIFRQFPTRAGVVDWIERQLQRIEEERLLVP